MSLSAARSLNIQSLPFELISQIFSICVHENETAPERIAFINQHLRSVALRCTDLWSFIHYTDQRDRPRLLAYLQRSGQTALDVELYPTPLAQFDAKGPISLLETLRHHSGRIRSLKVICLEGVKHLPRTFPPSIRMRTGGRLDSRNQQTGPEFLNLLLESIPPETRAFEHLTIALHQMTNITIFNLKLPTTLKTLDLLHAPLPLESFSAHSLIQCRNLQALRLNFPRYWDQPIEEFINLLGSFHRLQDLELIPPEDSPYFSNRSRDQLELNPTILPQLRSLKIPLNALFILPFISCPLITSLDIPVEEDQASFLRRHAKTITSLNVQETDTIDVSEYNSIIAAQMPCPSLLKLTGEFKTRSATRLLAAIRGVALVSATLELHWKAASDDVLQFFEAVSETLETAVVAGYARYDVIGISEIETRNPRPETSWIRFPCLKSFISRSRYGDIIISATKEAPKLANLHLYGAPYKFELRDEASFFLYLFNLARCLDKWFRISRFIRTLSTSL